MQIKVTDTRMHRTIGKYLPVDKDVPVAEAKLVLAELNSNDDMFGAHIVCLKTDKMPLGKYFKPILISETERIEGGNIAYYVNRLGGGKILCKAVDTSFGRVYHKLGVDPIKEYGSVTGGITPLPNEIFKVLSPPEHFSSKHLQAIVDGKMKDGDKVLVECFNQKFEFTDAPKYNKSYPVIKLNSSNHITLHKLEEKVYTREEMRQHFMKFIWKFTNINLTDIDEYFNNNVK